MSTYLQLSYPAIREYSRHYRDSFLVNDHQSDLDIRDDLCVFPMKELCCYQKLWCPIPFASAILAISETWLSVSPYLVQYRYRHCYLLVPVIFHPRDLVTYCNIGWISPSGPKVSSRHADEQIPLLMHTPQPAPLETRETPFLVTLLHCDGWCNQSLLR
jgi:hypothetical protein